MHDNRQVEQRTTDSVGSIYTVGSWKFYGFVILETDVPEYPDRYMHIDMERKIIYINKGAREGAKVVNLRF